jgi:argininosuccinate synthase
LNQDIKKIVVAYSGGLDTSVIITWLKDIYGAEVIAFTADIGQGEELEPLREKAIKTGASKIYIDDLREEFVGDFVFPMLRANAVYEGRYLLGTSIARPLIAKRQIEIARKERADAVCHGATGKGNDQVRFELTYFALQPDIKIVAPWREWTMKGREELIAYAEEHKIPVTATKSKPYSTDRNLLHISYEGGIPRIRGRNPQRTCTPWPCQLRRRLIRPSMSRSHTRQAIPWPSTGRSLLRPRSWLRRT